jgi:orotidine-5'-phosphate decarboxylase
MMNPIFAAIDIKDPIKAGRLVKEIREHIGGVKLGLEFYLANGDLGLLEIQQAAKLPVFLDLKLHDIPNTVKGAIESLLPYNIAMTTIHSLGGEDMMKAAVEAAKKSSTPPKIFAVTILTSMSDIRQIGIEDEISTQVLRLAELALHSGVNGVVCSPHEIKMIRDRFGDELEIIAPGIRPEGSDAGDQKRTKTPREAIDDGADYIVIGRPITGSDNPKQAAQTIFASL